MLFPQASSNTRARHILRRVAHLIATGVDGPVGVACSGGTDSTGLLLGAAHAWQTGRLHPFVVLHVDHRTRPESAAEGQHVARLAMHLGVPVELLQVGDATSKSGSPEESLRKQRYAALAAAVRRLGLTGVVTAHTVDDQVETILLRLLAGTGALGATGMAATSTLSTCEGMLRVFRPLLSVRRAELSTIVAEAGVTPVEDPSNLDTRYRRNALRQEIVPHLERHFPGFSEALVRSVALSAQDAEFVDDVAASVAETVITRHGSVVSLSRAWVAESHPAVTSRVIRLVVRELLGSVDREIGYERTEAVRAAARGRTGAVVELPFGIRVVVARGSLDFSRMRKTDGDTG
ncbi:MAG: tRNA lysidine(34) synthetase TilS [Chloroflexi bacterium]|nr:MAG: tRNA lysidine(34) synthetase TilS [Chloroflexota bacterium]